MSATGRGAQRQAFDFYATPPETIQAFLANFDNISLIMSQMKMSKRTTISLPHFRSR